MLLRIAVILPAILVAVSTAAQSESEDAAAVKPELKTQECLATRRLKSNVVIDDANILFFMIGNTVYHNRLPENCNGLLRYKTFTYRQIAGRICDGDVINVHRSLDPGVVRRCRIGHFEEIDSRDIPALISTLHRPPDMESLPSAEVEDVGESPEPGEAENPD